MSPVATLKHKKASEAAPKQRLPKVSGPRHPHSPEAATRRREFALLMRSIKTMVHQSP
jgi:hypothetical protein